MPAVLQSTLFSIVVVANTGSLSLSANAADWRCHATTRKKIQQCAQKRRPPTRTKRETETKYNSGNSDYKKNAVAVLRYILLPIERQIETTGKRRASQNRSNLERARRAGTRSRNNNLHRANTISRRATQDKRTRTSEWEKTKQI